MRGMSWGWGYLRKWSGNMRGPMPVTGLRTLIVHATFQACRRRMLDMSDDLR